MTNVIMKVQIPVGDLYFQQHLNNWMENTVDISGRVIYYSIIKRRLGASKVRLASFSIH